MTQNLQSVRRIPRYDFNGRIIGYAAGKVPEFAVNPNGNGITGQALADRAGYLLSRHVVLELAFGTVG
jgi:hypothetical protein